jgi:asparagine synthase (glutamine-hydrolysing)
MCGVAGFVYNNKHSYDKETLLGTMLEQIAHRGYDNRGTYFDTHKNYQLGLGHNRLSIIDTSSRANQPYHFDNLSIIFNGEIYNYEELWDELKKNGYSIDTTSDTEVILKLFHLHKEEAFKFLNGMFAIIIHDNTNDKLYLVRDRMGVKPLIYYSDNEHIYFSSEIKSIYRGIPKNRDISINKKLINNYFKYGYINSFDSIFTNIKKVKNGQVVCFDLNSFQSNESFFWELDKVKGDKIYNIDVAYRKLREVVDSAVKYRLVSDVGYGIFLSSGIDSNLVMNVILSENPNEVNSYTYQGVNNESNEDAMFYDPQVVKQHYVQLTDEQLWDNYKKLCVQYDEPFSDPATVGLYGLSQKAKELNRVILVGDGGDELLGGYQSYEELYYYTRPSKKLSTIRVLYKPFAFILNWFFNKFPLAKHVNRIHLYHTILKHSNLFDIIYELENRFVPLIEKLTDTKVESESIQADNKNSIISFLNYKVKTELIHQLNYKTDIAGMLHTIEIREPLLDYRLFELQQRFSDNILYDKSKNVSKKYLYRKILKSYNQKLTDLKKKGFKVDLDKVFKSNKLEIDELIESHNSNYLNMDYVKFIWGKYKNSEVDFVVINRILSFLFWENNLINRI